MRFCKKVICSVISCLLLVGCSSVQFVEREQEHIEIANRDLQKTQELFIDYILKYYNTKDYNIALQHQSNNSLSFETFWNGIVLFQCAGKMKISLTLTFSQANDSTKVYPSNMMSTCLSGSKYSWVVKSSEEIKQDLINIINGGKVS